MDEGQRQQKTETGSFLAACYQIMSESHFKGSEKRMTLRQLSFKSTTHRNNAQEQSVLCRAHMLGNVVLLDYNVNAMSRKKDGLRLGDCKN